MNDSFLLTVVGVIVVVLAGGVAITLAWRRLAGADEPARREWTAPRRREPDESSAVADVSPMGAAADEGAPRLGGSDSRHHGDQHDAEGGGPHPLDHADGEGGPDGGADDGAGGGDGGDGGGGGGGDGGGGGGD
ncbi:MAG: hypothetical protein JNM07_11240 [Phycisphaerae bacterium]|nr:hypothetical protein [Phycisphaerae bacterium]